LRTTSGPEAGIALFGLQLCPWGYWRFHSIIDFSLEIRGFAIVVFALLGVGVANHSQAARPLSFQMVRKKNFQIRLIDIPGSLKVMLLAIIRSVPGQCRVNWESWQFRFMSSVFHSMQQPCRFLGRVKT
jgi:hypothetical protein